MNPIDAASFAVAIIAIAVAFGLLRLSQRLSAASTTTPPSAQPGGGGGGKPSTTTSTSSKIPPVLIFLGTGAMLRLALNDQLDPASVSRITRPICDACLALVGLQIGSHLAPSSVIAIGAKPLCAFLAVFFPIVFTVVVVAVWMIFPPSLHLYAPLVGCIALERSSPEALAGVSETKSKGLFTTSTIFVAAVMDCVALVTFVVASAVVSSSALSASESSSAAASTTSAGAHLMHLGIATVVSAVVTSVLVMLLESIPPSSAATTSSSKREALGGAEGEKPPPASVSARLLAFLSHPAFLAFTAASTLLLMHRIRHTELLVAAISVGSFLNYRVASAAATTSHHQQQQHSIQPLLDTVSTLINLVLFTCTGLRIDVLAMLTHVPPYLMFVLFGARLTGLYCGGFAGSRVANFLSVSSSGTTASSAPLSSFDEGGEKPATSNKESAFQHPHLRGFALVTQLAIALALVQRMEDTFPAAKPLAQVAQGMVLFGLVSGPALLVAVLKLSGESNNNSNVAASSTVTTTNATPLVLSSSSPLGTTAVEVLGGSTTATTASSSTQRPQHRRLASSEVP